MSDADTSSARGRRARHGRRRKAPPGLSQRVADSRRRLFQLVCVEHCPKPPVEQVESLHLGEREGSRAAATEDGELVAALVNGAVAVESLRDGERGAVRSEGRDESRLRRGAKTP